MIKYTTTASVFALSSTFRLPLRRVARFRQKEVKTGRLVKFEFQINKESYFSIYLMQYLGRIPWLYSQCNSSHTIHCFFIFSWFSYADLTLNPNGPLGRILLGVPQGTINIAFPIWRVYVRFLKCFLLLQEQDTSELLTPLLSHL